MKLPFIVLEHLGSGDVRWGGGGYLLVEVVLTEGGVEGVATHD